MQIRDKNGYAIDDVYCSEDTAGCLGKMFKYESYPSCTNCSKCTVDSNTQNLDGYGVGYFIDSVVIWCKKCGYTIDQFYFDQPEANERKVMSYNTAFVYADDFFTEDMLDEINNHNNS
jgi:hypothetical protein